MTLFKIVRYYSDNRKPVTLRANVTQAQAREWCQGPITSGTLRTGVKWFDGYTRMTRKYTKALCALALLGGLVLPLKDGSAFRFENQGWGWYFYFSHSGSWVTTPWLTA